MKVRDVIKLIEEDRWYPVATICLREAPEKWLERR